jgi:hypothetical protein
MRIDTQVQLFQALNAHKSDLEIERAAAPDCGLEERIEATGRVLTWLEEAASRRDQPEARTLHHDVNLLLGKIPSRAGARTARGDCGTKPTVCLRTGCNYSAFAPA